MKKYDADEKAREAGAEITIGGQVFYGVEPTLDQMKDIAENIPEEDLEKDSEGNVIPKSEKVQLEESIDAVYPQLEVLLSAKEEFSFTPKQRPGESEKPKAIKVKEGDPPPKQFVTRHLTMRRAGEIIQMLMGEEEAARPR